MPRTYRLVPRPNKAQGSVAGAEREGSRNGQVSLLHARKAMLEGVGSLGLGAQGMGDRYGLQLGVLMRP